MNTVFVTESIVSPGIFIKTGCFFLTDLSMQETFSTLFSLTSCSCLRLHEVGFIKNYF